MTGRTADDRPSDPGTSVDPFVTQIRWLLTTTGGREELARLSSNRVSPRTLDNWTAGRYPRNRVTGAVRDLDAWAMEQVAGYPTAAGVPRLIDSCGPSIPPSPEPEPEPTPTRRRRWLRWTVLSAVLLVAALATTAVSLARDEPLPTRGTGTLWPEETGSLGANTFADPVKLQDQALSIPPNTTVQVRCRFYAPSIPSVDPDGYWYLIDSGKWRGRWSPANSFMNGDVPGQPTLHNTDFAVPICK
jgi:hypothetical protein